MRTSFHHQPEAQHPIFQLSTSWQADYPIFRGKSGRVADITAMTEADHYRTPLLGEGGVPRIPAHDTQALLASF
jgi:hypothetical protein